MNRRAQIRKYVTDKIESAPLEVNVFKSRRRALQSSELSAVIVSIGLESNELFSQSGQEVKKIAELSIEMIANAEEEEVIDDIDQLTSQIESLLHADESFKNLIDRCVLKSTEVAMVREGEIDLGLARMLFDVTYYTRYSPEQANFNAFTEVSLNFDKKEKVT